MPLFKCQHCGCVENTALSGYWTQQRDASVRLAKALRPPPTNNVEGFAPKCSECETGKWHGQFTKEPASAPKWKRGDDGFLYQADGWKPSNVRIIGDA